MTINWYKPSQCILILVTVSSLFVFVGCLVCGFLLHFAPEEPSEDVNGGIYTSIPAITLLSAAILTVVTLVLGWCGACRDSKLILLVFSTLALVVAAIVLASGATVFGFIMNGQIHQKLSTVMEEDLETYSEDRHVDHNMFNTIQTDYKCCGVDGYSDWLDKNTTWKREQDNTMDKAPSSCCVTNTTACNQDTQKLHQKGCLVVLLDRMKIAVYAVFGVCIALSLFQTLTALCACYGARLIQRYQTYDIL